MSGRILACVLAVLLMMVAGAAELTRVVQAEEILKKIELGQPVEYNNVIVEGDLDLSGLDLPRVAIERMEIERNHWGLLDYELAVTSPIIIVNSVILGSVNLNGTFFQNITIFTSTSFREPVFMIGSKFNQDSSFSDAQFNQTATFDGARFNQNASFMGAQFNQTAGFGRAWFDQDSNFWDAQFNQTAYFSGAQFNTSAFFWGAQFNQNTDFDGARFSQTAIFWHAQFNQFVSFWRAQFFQTADLSDAKFKQESYFRDASFVNLFFNDSQFSKEAIFDGAQISGTLSLYRTKYDALNIRWSSIHDLAYDDTAYHLLIQNFNKLGFADDARECQYSYRCKHREELFRQHKFDSWLFDLLAYATYGYGLRPVRPLGWAALFILVGGQFFFLTGSVIRPKESPSGKKPLALRRKEEKPDGNVSIWESLLLSATYFTSGASSIISATPTEFVPVGRGRYVVVLLRLLGWIFFVLFLSSLNRTI